MKARHGIEAHINRLELEDARTALARPILISDLAQRVVCESGLRDVLSVRPCACT